MEKLLLNGEYTLYVTNADDGIMPQTAQDIPAEGIRAVVPGNVELDLMREGLLPDLYKGQNIRLAENLERKNFRYVKDFSADEQAFKKARLVFCGVDTFAEYYLNGEKIGESDNALIPFTFDVSGKIKGENRLEVHIRSAVKQAEKYGILPYNVAFSGCYESLNVRKSAASYGWDILPRAVSAGIWKDVYLESIPENEITDYYISTCRAEKDVAVLVLSVNATINKAYLGKCTLKFTAKCKDSEISAEYSFAFNALTVYPYIRQPKLWYPAGSGAADLYDCRIAIVSGGEIIAEKSFRYGVRKIDVLFGEKIGADGDFHFVVNGETVRVRGADHTPIDVYHSKDREKTAEVVENIAELNANLVRIWGGGVYENDEFYDLCDEKGIMVWQDVMLACHAYPQTEEFSAAMARECEKTALRIRNHPSIALWCGSNETDWAYVCVGLDPNDDKITRKVIADTLKSFDPYRTYLPSTPYFSREYVKDQGGKFYLDLDEITEVRKVLPEEHYWWHRNDFLRFSDQSHRFIAEIGYGGCPAKESAEKFLEGQVDFNNDGQWECHSYPTENTRKTGVLYLFSNVPETCEDLMEASAYYQAEAYKYIAEKSRANEDCNGIVLWNLRDGYPIFASSLVDYYGKKKPSYHAVKRSYEPLQCMITDGKAMIVNDCAFKGTARLKIVSGNKTVLEKSIFLRGEKIVGAGKVKLPADEGVLIFLTADGKTIRNYAYGYEEKIDYRKYVKFIQTVEL